MRIDINFNQKNKKKFECKGEGNPRVMEGISAVVKMIIILRRMSLNNETQLNVLLKNVKDSQ